MCFSRLSRIALVSFVVLASTIVNSHAQTTTLYSTSFESPTFTTGSALAGTGGFSGSSDPEYAITGVRASTGAQSVVLDTAPLGGSVWSWVDLTPNAGTVTQPFVVASIDIFIDTTTTQGTTTSGFGLDAYSSSVTRLGAARIRGNGVVELLQDNTVVSTGLTANLNQWNKLELILNPTTGTATARLNGTLTSSATTTFVVGTAIADIDLYSAPFGFETGYFDNYIVTQRSSVTVVVPEPTTLALVGLGTVLIGVVRRRKVVRVDL